MSDLELNLKILKDKYEKATLTKKELAWELNISESSINQRISQALDLPNYKKLGSGKGAKVVFPLIEVARYLTETVKIA